jgi:uncharacterized protein (DUF433 family)
VTEFAHDHGLEIGNVVAAFTEDQVARMTGLSVSRLRGWARTGFFKPGLAAGEGGGSVARFYTFKDVVALRVLEMLRERAGVPTRQLREVAVKLSHLRDDLWTRTTLHATSKRVHVATPETTPVELALNGQPPLEVPLNAVIETTRADVLALNQRRPGTEGRVARAKSIARNAWVVDGTRVPVAAVQRLHADGYDVARIIAEYPDLTAADVEAALRHGGERAA